MLKEYKIRSSAVRAVKAEFGDAWAESCGIIANENGTFSYDMLTKAEMALPVKPEIVNAQLLSDIAVVELLNQSEADQAEKADKKAEIESRKPLHIPKLPAGIAVASESTPTPNPSLPAFLKIAPPAEKEVPEASDAELAHLFGLADKAANVQAANVDALKPRLSTAALPTKLVWHVADEMVGAKRKDVIEECVRRGIAYGTARTQYQHWFKTKNDSAATPIATIGKDGKITYPGK